MQDWHATVLVVTDLILVRSNCFYLKVIENLPIFKRVRAKCVLFRYCSNPDKIMAQSGSKINLSSIRAENYCHSKVAAQHALPLNIEKGFNFQSLQVKKV